MTDLPGFHEADPYFWVGYFGGTLTRIAAEGNDDARGALQAFINSPFESINKEHMRKVLTADGTPILTDVSA